MENTENDEESILKDLLGHESLSSTQIYTHLDAKKMKEIYDKSHPHAK